MTGGWPTFSISARTSRAASITAAIASISRPRITSFRGGLAGFAVVPGFGSASRNRAEAGTQPGSGRSRWSSATRMQKRRSPPRRHDAVPGERPCWSRSCPCSVPLASTNWPDCSSLNFPAPPTHVPVPR